MKSKCVGKSKIARKSLGLVLLAFLVGLASSGEASAQSAIIRSPKLKQMRFLEQEMKSKGLEVKKLLKQQKEIESDLVKADKKVDLVKQKLSKVAVAIAKPEANKAAIKNVIPELVRQRVELKIELAGLEAKKNVVEKMLKEKVAESEEDIVVKKFRELVHVRQRQLQQTMDRFKGGSISKETLAEAEVKLLDSEIALQKAVRESRGENLKLFETTLRDLSLEHAEKSAKLMIIEKMVKDFLGAEKAHIEKSDMLTQLNYQLSLKDGLVNSRKSVMKDMTKTLRELKDLEAQLARLKAEK